MQIKYTKHFLNKLEDIFAESDYHLRYEKGSFKSGYCILKDTKIVIVNKYYPLEGKVNCLLEILKEAEIDRSLLGEKNKHFLHDLKQTKLEL
jgi:hypothetical protein